MKILITGGSGFIGTNIIESLKKDFELLNIDIKEPKIINHKKFWKKIDICNYDSFKKAVITFNPDYILHLAARTDLNGHKTSDYQANISGVKNLMNIIKGLTNLKKIVITSSMLVCHGGYYPDNQFDYSPTTTYGESKVETEKIVWSNKPACDWAILRPTSIWGEWFDIPYKNFFNLIINKKYFHIGNKSCTKTYGYIGNSVYQIEQILFSKTNDEKEKVFFIGDNPPTNIETWSNEISAELGIKIIRVPFLMIKYVAKIGDLLKIFRIEFPMTSFRLHNMTTNNIIDLSNTYHIAPDPPYCRIEGIRRTLEWMRKE